MIPLTNALSAHATTLLATSAAPAGLKDYMNPDYLLDRFGTQFFWVSVVIVFIECGLLFPILPGDSLLFACGMFIAGEKVSLIGGGPVPNLLLACVLLSAAAFLGNVAGYEIGRAAGRPLYERDGRILKRKYFDQTNAFFAKHGAKALVIGRFVPIVRTFVTVVAGVGRMNRTHFFMWSGVGAVLWACSMTILGYFLGKFDFVKNNIEAAAILIVLISLLPMLFEYLAHRRRVARGEVDTESLLTDSDELTRDAEYRRS